MRRLLSLFCGGLAVVALCAAPMRAQALFSSPKQAEAAMRPLWTPARARFLRQWLLLGPVAGGLTQTPQVAAAPTPGLKQSLSNGRTSTWQAQSSWVDVVSLSDLLDAPAYRGSAAPLESAYAYTTIARDAATEAVLSLASDGPMRVWLNGKLVETVATPRPFLFDQTRVPVHLDKGDNGLLIQLAHRSGPWRFAVRLLKPGQVVTPVNEITPALSVGHDGVLDIRTDITADNSGAPVHVAAVAPGGDVVEQADAPRGAVVHFSTASWPDGPYDIRATTTTAWGMDAAAHLSWYKGDARPAAAKLLEAAQQAPPGLPGATLRLLATMVRERLGDNPLAAPDDSWPLVHSALMEYDELQQKVVGKPGPVRPYGFVRLAYTDEVDGSTQFCRAYLPAHYDATERWPVIVNLHGFAPANPPYSETVDVGKRHDATADRYGVILLEPYGRGNSQYAAIGEQDVLHCLAVAKQRFNIDDDRVYLTGESMGGSGTWLIASHHPDLFAAAAPIFGGFDYRIDPGWDGGFVNPGADQVPERYTLRYQSSFRDAESLSNLPLFVTHGDSDQTVPVDFSRFAVTMLQRWNYNIRYEEIPGRGHEDLDIGDRIDSWLLAHRRIPVAHEVRIRAFDLDTAGAYWARVVAFDEPLQAMEVDAAVLRPGLIRLDTRNVAAIRLAPPAELRGPSALQIVWNGRPFKVTPDAQGAVLLTEPGTKALPGDKRPGLEGGLSNIIATPFAVVMGTISSDPRLRALCRDKADAFVQQWVNWQHVKPRLFKDTEITPADERRYSLILVGGADANLISRRLMPRLPLRVDADAVTIDGERFAARDAVVQMIYPSPVSPARYVMVVASTSADGMYFWNAAGLWNMPFGYPTQAMDWTIRDGRLVAIDPGLGTQRSAIASGIFDRHWRLDDRYVFRGDAALRAASPLRRPPPAGVAPTAAMVAANCGQYQLQPGFNAVVRQRGNGLAIDIPGTPEYALNEESDNVFVLGDTGIAVVFSRDAQGHTTGLTINQDGVQTPATKLN